jgi:hypothetical protein
MKLKLINAERYISPALNNDLILKGQVVTVDDEAVSTMLLAETRVDALNNEHPLWKDVSDEADEADEAAGDGGDGAAKPARAARTSKKSGS